MKTEIAEIIHTAGWLILADGMACERAWRGMPRSEKVRFGLILFWGCLQCAVLYYCGRRIIRKLLR